MRGSGWGNLTSYRLFLRKAAQGEVQCHQEARPKPTSWTGFLERKDKEEEGATWRRVAAPRRAGG